MAKTAKPHRVDLLRCHRGTLIFDRTSYIFRQLPDEGLPQLIKVGETEEALLRAIYDGRDNTPVLVYADWLSDNGMELAATDIRHRLALAERTQLVRYTKQEGKKPRKPSRRDLLFDELEKLQAIRYAAMHGDGPELTQEQRDRFREMLGMMCRDCGYMFPMERHVCSDNHLEYSEEDRVQYVEAAKKRREKKLFAQ